MDPLALALDGHEPLDAREGRDLARARELLGAADPWSRARPLHVTASALVVDPPARRLLLRWHEHLRRWMQVGGHADPGERDPWQVARREATEETGLTDLRPLTDGRPPRPLQVVVVPVPASASQPAHEHADLRYALATDRPGEATPEAEAAPLRWLTLAAALEALGEEDLRELARRVAELLG